MLQRLEAQRFQTIICRSRKSALVATRASSVPSSSHDRRTWRNSIISNTSSLARQFRRPSRRPSTRSYICPVPATFAATFKLRTLVWGVIVDWRSRTRYRMMPIRKWRIASFVTTKSSCHLAAKPAMLRMQSSSQPVTHLTTWTVIPRAKSFRTGKAAPFAMAADLRALAAIKAGSRAPTQSAACNFG